MALKNTEIFSNPAFSFFLAGKKEAGLILFDHFISEYKKLGKFELVPTKTMIAIDNGKNRVAWITQIGKNFLHVVFPLKKEYKDNLCFQKVGQVPNSNQFNHHLRVLFTEDINDEVKRFMMMALKGEG